MKIIALKTTKTKTKMIFISIKYYCQDGCYSAFIGQFQWYFLDGNSRLSQKYHFSAIPFADKLTKKQRNTLHFTVGGTHN